MKIQISKSESHEINIPESLTASEFLMLTSRFQQLARIFSKDPAIDSSLIGGTKKKKLLGVGREHGNSNFAARKILKENREVLVKLIETYYNSDKNLIFEVAKEFGLGDYIKNRAIMSSGSIVKLRKMHNITANEVGLKAWPGKYKQPEKL